MVARIRRFLLIPSIALGALISVANSAQTNSPATGAPTISGNARVGDTLTAGLGTISDTNGRPGFPGGFTFQWVRGSSDIADAISHEYTLTDADESQMMKVKVSFTDDDGFSEGPLESEATASVAAAPADGCTPHDLQLLGGDIAREGSVLICRNNEWGHVCDDRWAKVDANVACKQLGYTNGAQKATVLSEFVSLIKVKYWLDDVECTGSESTLAECEHGGWGVHNCQFSERAGAVCKANVNVTATGVPKITGTAATGEVLSASTDDIADDNGKTKADNAESGFAYTYAWFRVDSDGISNKTAISGATSSTYTLVTADEGKKIIVEVSFTDDESNSEGPLASDPYPATHTVEATDTTPPVFVSAKVESATLVITFNESLAAAANLANSAFTVKVTTTGGSEATATLSGSPSISGATVTLTLNTAVVFTDTVTVSYEKATSGTANKLADSTGNEVASFTDASVTNVRPVTGSAVGNPVIKGPAQVGMTLTADVTDIIDPDGIDNAVFTYQWSRGGTNITNATGSTYIPTSSDLGNKIRVNVEFTDDNSNAESVASDETDFVMPAAALNCAAPNTIWCTILTAGQKLIGSEFNPGSFSVSQVGYSAPEGFGSLEDDMFTYQGVEYTIIELFSGGLNDIIFQTTPNLPLGNGLSLHVQRVVGELDARLTETRLNQSGRWYFVGLANLQTFSGYTFEDSPLLHAPFVRDHTGGLPTDAGSEIAVRLSVVAEPENVLVSNFLQESNLVPGLSALDLAQGFTTGSNQWGYTLTSLGVLTTATVESTFGTATLRQDSPTGSDVVSLTVPESILSTGAARFVAPDATSLDPDSTYYLVLDGGNAPIISTPDSSEDSSGLQDWGILDVSHERVATSTGAFQQSPEPLLLTVFGEVNPEPDLPRVSFARSSYSVTEGETVTVAVEISEAPTTAVEVQLTLTDRNGATSADYSIGASRVVFVPQNTRVQFDVTAIDDTDDDDGESVRITLGELPSNVLRGAFDYTTIQIEDNDGAAPTSGDLRLVGGPLDNEGRLEIYFREEWGTVCDDRFFEPVQGEKNRAKDVACKLLGFDSGEETTGYGQSGVSLADQPIWLDDVRCLASVPAHRVDNPRSLFDCYYAGPGLHNCSHDEDVGLRCLNVGMSMPDITTDTENALFLSVNGSDELQLHWPSPIGRAPTGYEVQYRTTNGQWQTWTHTTAETSTVITGLAPATEYEVRVRATFVEGVSEWMSMDLGRATTLDDVAEGDIRLVNGTTPHEGRLEVYHNAEWGTVCDDRFTSDDAEVVCRQLGYAGGEVHTQPAFGTGTGTIWMDDLRCEGGESRLMDCSFTGWGANNCQHSEDVGVSCGAESSMSLIRATLFGIKLTLDYDRELDDWSIPSPRDFVVTAESPMRTAEIPVLSVTAVGDDVVLTLARSPSESEKVAISYLPAPMYPLRDTSYNPAHVLTNQRVQHIQPMESGDDSTMDTATSVLQKTAPRFKEKIEVLNLSGSGHADLSALAGLTDLEAIDLSENHIEDLWPLSQMVRLQSLDLSSNAVTDLVPLGTLSGLRVLDLSGNAVSDLSPLNGLTALRRLNLSGNRITDIGPLSDLRQLEVLILDENHVMDLVPLFQLNNLAHLSLRGNQVDDAWPLRGHRSLQRLDLAGNALLDVFDLHNLPELVWLRLTGNPVKDLYPLQQLRSLRWLVLDDKVPGSLNVPSFKREHETSLLIEITEQKTTK